MSSAVLCSLTRSLCLFASFLAAAAQTPPPPSLSQQRRCFGRGLLHSCTIVCARGGCSLVWDSFVVSGAVARGVEMAHKRARDETEYESSLDTSAPKRRRTLEEDDDDDEYGEVDALSDQETQNSVSISIEDANEDGDAANDHANGVRGHRGTNGTPASQSSSSQQYEADDYLPEEAEMRLIDSIPGVIERIELENFMCHANLEIEFNKHINFISGVNGSTEPLV